MTRDGQYIHALEHQVVAHAQSIEAANRVAADAVAAEIVDVRDEMRAMADEADKAAEGTAGEGYAMCKGEAHGWRMAASMMTERLFAADAVSAANPSEAKGEDRG